MPDSCSRLVAYLFQRTATGLTLCMNSNNTSQPVLRIRLKVVNLFYKATWQWTRNRLGFIFHGLKRTFRGVERIFHGLERTFHAVEYKSNSMEQRKSFVSSDECMEVRLFHRMNVWRFEGFPCVSYLPVLPKKWAFLCNYVNEVNIFHWKFCINESLLFICKSFQWK